MIRFLSVAALAVFASSSLLVQPSFAAEKEWTPAQQEIVDASWRHHHYTRPDTLDLDAWEADYDEEYLQWFMNGPSTIGREAAAGGLRGWLAAGNHVLPPDSEVLEVKVFGDTAIELTRVAENYQNVDGSKGGYRGHLMRVWRREGDRWVIIAGSVVPDAADH